MFRCIPVILFGVASCLGSTRTPAQADDLPIVLIGLPRNVPSETVQISYFLVGPFGGHSGYIAQRAGVRSYEIPTVVEGKAATEIRMIVYASGCEIQQFQVDLPYFSVDAEASSSEQRASFRLMLRDSKTGNHIASNLEPEKQELRLQEDALQVRSQYPDDLIFTAADPFVKLTPVKGKVFRSDSGEAISNSYILLTSETDEARHFDTRTDEKGEYLFGGIPTGNYKVSVYAWFAKRSEVPCQNPLEQKTVDGGDITVEWQWKSHAFMEIVKLKGVSIRFDGENVKDFDLVGR